MGNRDPRGAALLPARLPWRRPGPGALALGLGVTALAVLVGLPLVSLLWRSLAPDGSLTLAAYRDAFGGIELGSIAGATAAFALGAAGLGLGLGTALALALVRTDLPGRRLLLGLALAPLVLPGVLHAVAWIFLAAPTAGLLAGVPGVPSAFGLGGMILVEGTRLAPVALLLVAAALTVGDPALEEAARVGGACRGAVLRRITLPLLRPALAAAGLLLLVRALGSFEVPALLGPPGQAWVLTSRVWLQLGEADDPVSRSAAASAPLLVLTVVGTVVLAVVLRRSRARGVVSPRGHRRRSLELGRWRLPVLALVAAYVGAAVLLPIAALAWMSTQPFLAPLSGDALARADGDAYAGILDDELVHGALGNSLVAAAAAGALAAALAAILGWAALRGRAGRGTLLDAVAFLPLALPGLVLGVALSALLVRVPFLYGTAAALVLGYVARYLPYAVRLGGAGVARIGRDVEDAARVAGVGWWPTLVRVVVPLAAASFAAAWLAVFTFGLTDVSLSLVLYSPGNEVLGVRVWSLYESGSWDRLAALATVTVALVLALALATAGLTRVALRRSRALA